MTTNGKSGRVDPTEILAAAIAAAIAAVADTAVAIKRVVAALESNTAAMNAGRPPSLANAKEMLRAAASAYGKAFGELNTAITQAHGRQAAEPFWAVARRMADLETELVAVLDGLKS